MVGTLPESKEKKNELLSRIETLQKDRSDTGNQKTLERISTVALEIGDSQFGGLPGFRIHARVRSNAVRDALPDNVDGIPVRIAEAPRSGLASPSCTGTGYFNPVPGGIAVWGEKFGSVTTEVKFNGNDRLMTAAHLFWTDNTTCDVQVGENAYIDNDSHKIGEVSSYDKGRDFVLIDDKGSPKYANEVRDYDSSFNTWTRKSVDGYVAEAGVPTLMMNNTPVYQVGLTTGETSGYIKNTGLGSADSEINCVDFGGEGIEGDYKNAEGDSGGPVYHINNGGAYMINPYQQWFTKNGTINCLGGTNQVGKTGAGTAAWEIHDQWGIKWNT